MLQDIASARTADATNRNVVSVQDPDSSLFAVYCKHFMVVPANGASLRERFYRLRYQVYCLENPFEDASAHPNGLEIDEFDAHSVNSLVIHVPTGMVAGGIRLILPCNGESDLPVWRVCDRDVAANKAAYVPASRTAEVSRNSVSKEFRQLCVHTMDSEGRHELRRVMRHLSLGSLAAVIHMASVNGITHITAAMESPMLRMFASLGLHFQKLGGPVEYHGVRQPAYAELDSLLARVWVERPDVWEIMTHRGKYWPLNEPLAQAIAAGARGRSVSQLSSAR
jgi:N-acyl amino acid synthase of PEP-CTERM/exosortase system